MSDFAARVDALIAEHFALNPLHATGAGLHTYDGRWPDMTEAGRAERIAFCDRWTAELRDLAATDLSADERIDADFLQSELAAHRFAETELREECWSPLEWVYLLGEGVFSLIAREFAPLSERLTSLASRLEGMPALLDSARMLLVGANGRPVDRLHTEKALSQVGGIGALIDDALAQANAAAAADPAVAVVGPRLRAAAAGARAALDAFETHLREVVLPATDGEGRIGRDLFAAKLVHTFRTTDTTIETIRARAQHEFEAVRAEMVRIARGIWPTWRPDESPPSDDTTLVRGVLDAIATDHPAAADVLDFCRAELVRVEAFCREKDLIGLADEPLEIRWTPLYMRTFGGAMLESPGPFDKGQKAFFSVTPVEAEWSPERAESYLRESNARQLQLLVIHEAVPGHYLQGVYANRSASVARTIFWSGVFAEGWAVYVSQVMIDAGFADEDPALLLNHWKYYLRSTTNALIDIGIHTAGMTEAEAIDLMVQGGFQEEAEALAKYDRARLSSTQLCTYFVGSVEMWDLERERRRRLAIASGDPRGAAAVPESRVVGGLGATPGFVYREHLEEVISHGTPPIPFLRRIVLGEEAVASRG